MTYLETYESKGATHHVVWTHDCARFHLASMPDKFVPGKSNVRTRCGAQVYVPVIHTADITREIERGEQNCQRCFS